MKIKGIKILVPVVILLCCIALFQSCGQKEKIQDDITSGYITTPGTDTETVPDTELTTDIGITEYGTTEYGTTEYGTTDAETEETQADTDNETETETGNNGMESTGAEEETTMVIEDETCKDSFAYNEEELSQLKSVIEKQAGLIATYYSDTAMTGSTDTKICGDVNGIPADRDSADILAVKYEGYICFDESGEHILTLDGIKSNGTISIICGEHHVSSVKGAKFNARKGTWYGINITVTRKSSQIDAGTSLLCDGQVSGFTLNIGRPLLENNPASVSPAMDIPMRDCQVCAGPDGAYYMTGTSGPDYWDHSNDIHVYKSTDLESWTDLGAVWDFAADATWAKTVSKDTRVPVWAPEINYVNNNWYIVYSMGFNDGYCGGILNSTTGEVTGPYTDTSDKPLVDNIDLSLFGDDDGSVYLLYKDGLIAKLNGDMSACVEKFRLLTAADGLPVGFEGTSILKHNGKYYLTGATYNVSIDAGGNRIITYDSMVAVSDNVYGPYSTTRLLLRNGGHNNLFADTDGNVWTTLFAPTGNLGFFCKPAIVKLACDERGVLTPALSGGVTVAVGDDGLFRVSLGNGKDSVITVSIRTRRETKVYINNIYAFTAKPSTGLAEYKVSGDAFASVISGINRITFSDTRNADIEAYVKVMSYK